MSSSSQRAAPSRWTGTRQGGQKALYESNRRPQSPFREASQGMIPFATKTFAISRGESLPARRFSSYEPTKDVSAISFHGLTTPIGDYKSYSPSLHPRFTSSTFTSEPLHAFEGKSDIRSRLNHRFSSPQPHRNRYSSASMPEEHDSLEEASEVPTKLEDKKKSIWNWKPLRALSHIGRQRFHCIFSAYVHAIKGLPPAMNGIRLSVHMRKEETKEGAVQTMPSRVYQGVVEFDESLFVKCTFYGSKGPANTMKFLPKNFIIYVTATDVEELDLGKHYLDVSRLLSDTVDERKGELKKGNTWDFTCDLAGKAKGGKLIVSFNYEVLDKDSAVFVSSKYQSSPPRRLTMQTSYSAPNSAHGTPQIRSKAYSPSAFMPSGEDLAMEYINLDDPSVFESSNEVARQQNVDMQSQYGYRISPNDSLDGAASLHESEKGHDPSTIKQTVNKLEANDNYNLPEEEQNVFENEQDFTVVDQGVEIDTSSTNMKKNPSDNNLGQEKIIQELNNVPDWKEQRSEEKSNVDLDVCSEDFREAETKEIVTYQMVMKTLDSLLEGTNAKEQAQREILEGFSQIERSVPEDVGIRDSREPTMTVSESQKQPENLDNEVDLVAGEFLYMLELENNLDDTKPNSPRAQLSKQFEQETFLDRSFGPELSDLSAGEVHFADQLNEKLVSMALDSNTEKSYSVSGLKKPATIKLHEEPKVEHIFVPPSMHTFKPQDPLPLGDGFGTVISVKDGGFLRSMNPIHFQSSTNRVVLVMQVSRPVVLPTEMGAGTVDILRNMASMGIENMAMQAMTAMPLEDITGMTLEKIALEGLADIKTYRNRRLLEGYSGLKRLIRDTSTQKSALLSTTDKTDDSVTLENLTLMAMLQIEALALDGLKIQSHMTEEEAPYALNAFSVDKSNTNVVATLQGVTGVHLLQGAKVPSETAGGVKGLMDMAITMDEWMVLDAGLHNETENSKAIMAAYHAVPSNDRKAEQDPKNKDPLWGCMGNALTISMLIQLLDPLNSFEAVGSPMMAFLNAERVVLTSNLVDGSRGTLSLQSGPRFVLTGVHMSGFKVSQDNKRPAWGSVKQFQAGSRWLLASGLSKSSSSDSTKLPALVKTRGKYVDSLWSISAQVHGRGNRWKDSMKLKPHIRNPDVVYDNRVSRSTR